MENTCVRNEQGEVLRRESAASSGVTNDVVLTAVAGRNYPRYWGRRRGGVGGSNIGGGLRFLFKIRQLLAYIRHPFRHTVILRYVYLLGSDDLIVMKPWNCIYAVNRSNH